MKAYTLALFATSLPLAFAHTRFTTLFVNGESQGDGACVRMNMDGMTTTDYIGYVDAGSTPGSQQSLSSPDMACGVEGATPVARTCPLNAGDKIGLLHRLWTDGSQPGAIDPSHNGSTALYMKKMASADSSEPWSSDAAGDGWFKLTWSGYDENTGLWGTGQMIANDGLVETVVPSDLSSGYYLIRSEILTLQNVPDETVNPQFYAGCAQVYIAGTGTAEPSQTVAIPGYIDENTPALSYNIYKWTPPQVQFEEFGPAVYTSEAALKPRSRRPDRNRVKVTSVPTTTPTTAPTTAPTTVSNTVSGFGSIVGVCPSDTVLAVANECLTEIPSWSNDTPGALPKCWAASQSCWDKSSTCWKNVSPAIDGTNKNVGCNLWDAKCAKIVDWCNAGNLQGPPDAGQKLG